MYLKRLLSAQGPIFGGLVFWPGDAAGLDLS